MATVIDSLTAGMLADYGPLRSIIEQMDETFRPEDILQGVPLPEFLQDKYTGVLSVLRSYYESISSNEQVPSSMKEAIQVNILEAVKVDIDSGYTENVKVGLALAAALDTGGVSFEPHTSNHESKWELGSHWVEAYTTWNMALLVGMHRVEDIFKLMIPSVAGTMFLHGENGNGFVSARLISLALSLMRFRDIRTPMLALGTLDHERLDNLARDMGHFNMANVQLPPVTKHNVEDMLFALCQSGQICLSEHEVSESFPLDHWLNDK
mmetsp:Transcript_38002/g.78977  ORF Transcript_38002/g.78977 Transcript_38002/m.78977 type:complete len:266 (+) Transcript_38002:367-1164(+)